jgi:CheY-like chemotaxis protein
MILENETVRRSEHRRQIIENIGIVDKKIIALNGIAKRKELVERLTISWGEFKGLLDRISSYTEENRVEEAQKLSDSDARLSRETMIMVSEEIISANMQEMEVSRQTSSRVYNTSVSLIVLTIFLSSLLIAFISFWIISSIKKRIKFIEQEATRIASRDLASTITVDNTNDEFRPIYNSLQDIFLSFKDVTDNANAVASGDYSTDIRLLSEKDALGMSLQKMTVSLRKALDENQKHNWLVTGQNKINELLRGDRTTEDLANRLIRFLVPYLKGSIGSVYIYNDEENRFELKGNYGLPAGEGLKAEFKTGEGLAGQAALENKTILLEGVEESQLKITSSMVDALPRNILIVPFSFEGKPLGVIEVGKFEIISANEIEIVESLAETIAISMNSAIARQKIKDLLEETQQQSEELQSQSEELQSQSEELSQANAELEEQAQQLKQQQEELESANHELQEQTQILEEKNQEIEKARDAIEEKSRQVELSSKYKSEFLANMSHELRTPLNSLLILAKDLADNNQKNLSSDQVESAEIIYKSGQDLLSLINEVLDLAKIESGKMALTIEQISLEEFLLNIKQRFVHQAQQKGLYFNLEIEQDVPKHIFSDSQRLGQIIKNLLSNSLKFTEQGGITLKARKESGQAIAIDVADTGIGISRDKQDLIFEAFQQAEGGTSRKYGGTGLGLSISRELAAILGGRISLKSKEDVGSTFTLVIPLEIIQEKKEEEKIPKPAPPTRPAWKKDKDEFLNYPTIEDDRQEVESNEKLVLIIEDDLNFATVLQKQAHSRGFKCLSASSGEDGLNLAERYKPQAIILDLSLPGIDGNMVLAELKTNPGLRHIPVHIISGREKSMELIKEGAVEYLSKPVDKEQIDEAFNKIESFISRKMKNLLIIEDDATFRKAMKKLIGTEDINIMEAGTGEEALKILGSEYVDCIILDLGLPDMSGFDLINKLKEKVDYQIPPIIVNTGRELSKEENEELEEYTKSIIIKGVKSDERLLDETALFLHRTIKNLPAAKQQIISNLYDKEAAFREKKILLVDDDMRNVFALSKVLKERGMEVIKAENGLRAIEKLNENKDIDLVLMDIMMPEMDGYEAMRRIREQQEFKNLPIIALTAKAMKEDRQKTIDAGANDYIAKPVDLDRLLSLMRIWLSNQ